MTTPKKTKTTTLYPTQEPHLLFAGDVEAGERPVENRHRARQHTLHRAGGQRLSHLELPSGHRLGARYVPVNDGRPYAPAAVGLRRERGRDMGEEGRGGGVGGRGGGEKV